MEVANAALHAQFLLVCKNWACFVSQVNFTFLGYYWKDCRKVEMRCRKTQNFSVVFSVFCDFLKRKVKISSKISLTFAKEKCRISGTPSRGSPKG